MLQANNSCHDTTSPDVFDKSASGYSLYPETHLSEQDQSIIKQTPSGSMKPPLLNKPRIWSLADMASKEEKDQKHTHPTASMYQTTYGKLQPLLSSQMQYPLYMKSEKSKFEMYQNISCSIQSDPIRVGTSDYALVESYQRALAAHNNLQSSSQAFSSLLPMKPIENHQHSFSPPVHYNMNSATKTIISPQHQSRPSSSLDDKNSVVLGVISNADSNVNDVDLNNRIIHN